MNGTAIYQARDLRVGLAPPSTLLPPPVITESHQFCLLNISGLSPSLPYAKPPLLSAAPLLTQTPFLEQNFSSASLTTAPPPTPTPAR